jgi:hypothetical protein
LHEVNEVQCESCRTELDRALRGMLDFKGHLWLCPQIELALRGAAPATAEGGAPGRGAGDSHAHVHSHETSTSTGSTFPPLALQLPALPALPEVVLASALSKALVDQLREMMAPAVRRAGEAASKTYEGVDEYLHQMCTAKHLSYQIPSQRITDQLTSCRESCMKATDICHSIKARLPQSGEYEPPLLVGWADTSQAKLQELGSSLEACIKSWLMGVTQILRTLTRIEPYGRSLGYDKQEEVTTVISDLWGSYEDAIEELLDVTIRARQEQLKDLPPAQETPAFHVWHGTPEIYVNAVKVLMRKKKIMDKLQEVVDKNLQEGAATRNLMDRLWALPWEQLQFCNDAKWGAADSHEEEVLQYRVLLCCESIWHDMLKLGRHLDVAMKKGLQEWEQVMDELYPSCRRFVKEQLSPAKYPQLPRESEVFKAKGAELERGWESQQEVCSFQAKISKQEVIRLNNQARQQLEKKESKAGGEKKDGAGSGTAEEGGLTPLRPKSQTPADGDAKHHGPLTVQVSKSAPISAVMLHVRRQLGIPLHRQRLWLIARREDKTWRVSHPLCRRRPSSAPGHQQGEAFLDSEAQDLLEGGQVRIYVEELGETELAAWTSLTTWRGVPTEGSGDVREPGWLDTDSTDATYIVDEGQIAGGAACKEGDTNRLLRGEKGGLGHERRRMETLTERYRRLLGMIVEAERKVKTCDDLLAFLKAFPPPLVLRDSIFLLFKRYDRTMEDRPLEFLLCRRVRKAQTVRRLLAKLRGWVPGVPEQDSDVEVYEQATPHNVMRLKLDATLEELSLHHGDIICIQWASRKVDREDKFYNQPSLPHHLPAYLSYLVNRRTVTFRPVPSSLAQLQECVPFIEQNGLEHKDRCRLVRTQAGEAMDVILELSFQSTYRQMQEALARWLQPVVRDPLQFYFISTRFEQYMDEKWAPDRPRPRLHHFLSRDHRPSKAEMIFFEIRPFSSVQRPRVVPTPPEPSSPMPSAPGVGPANVPRAAEPADDWLEGVEHPAPAGKPKKGGKKGKKGGSKGRGRGAANVDSGTGPNPASDVELSDDTAEAAQVLADLAWIEDTADTAPGPKARRKRKKGRKGRGGGTATAEEAEGKVEGRVGSEGEQSDHEDGGEGGEEAEDRLALYAHGEDAAVELEETLSEAAAPVSDPAPAGGDGLSSEAEPPVMSELAPDDLSKHLEPPPYQHREELTKKPEEPLDSSVTVELVTEKDVATLGAPDMGVRTTPGAEGKGGSEEEGDTEDSRAAQLQKILVATHQKQVETCLRFRFFATRNYVSRLRLLRCFYGLYKTSGGMDERLHQMCFGKGIPDHIPSQRITDHMTSCHESWMKAGDLCYTINSRLTPSEGDERAMMVGGADESNGKLQQLVSFLETCIKNWLMAVTQILKTLTRIEPYARLLGEGKQEEVTRVVLDLWSSYEKAIEQMLDVTIRARQEQLKDLHPAKETPAFFICYGNPKTRAQAAKVLVRKKKIMDELHATVTRYLHEGAETRHLMDRLWALPWEQLQFFGSAEWNAADIQEEEVLQYRVLLCAESTIWINRHDLMQHEKTLDDALKKGLQEWEQVFDKLYPSCRRLVRMRLSQGKHPQLPRGFKISKAKAAELERDWESQQEACSFQARIAQQEVDRLNNLVRQLEKQESKACAEKQDRAGSGTAEEGGAKSQVPVQRPRVVSTPPEPSTPMPTPSAPGVGPASMPPAAEPADDWLEGVEHPARAGKPKKGGKKGKKGSSNRGRGHGAASVMSGAGRPASDVELSDDDGGVIATEEDQLLDDLAWIEGTADTAPAGKARRKRKKGRKGRGGGPAAAEEAEGKVEGQVNDEGEQSDEEDGGEGGAEAEDPLALHAHGDEEDATVELVEELSGAPAPVSDPAHGEDASEELVESLSEAAAPVFDPAGGNGLLMGAEPPAHPLGLAGGEQVNLFRWSPPSPLAACHDVVVGLAGGGGRARIR